MSYHCVYFSNSCHFLLLFFFLYDYNYFRDQCESCSCPTAVVAFYFCYIFQMIAGPSSRKYRSTWQRRVHGSPNRRVTGSPGRRSRDQRLLRLDLFLFDDDLRFERVRRDFERPRRDLKRPRRDFFECDLERDRERRRDLDRLGDFLGRARRPFFVSSSSSSVRQRGRRPRLGSDTTPPDATLRSLPCSCWLPAPDMISTSKSVQMLNSHRKTVISGKEICRLFV